MLIYSDAFPPVSGKTALALGTFDGVHAGHRAVIARAAELARENGLLAAVWCFSDIPKNHFLTKERKIPSLSSREDKISIMRSLGVDILVIPKVSDELLSICASDFLLRLNKSLSPAHIVCGYNYGFGRGGCGDPDMLRGFFTPLGIGVTITDEVKIGSVSVSSTLIRGKITRGDLDITKLLCRKYAVGCKIDGGVITFDPGLALPPEGEYEVSVEDPTKTTAAVIRIIDSSRGMGAVITSTADIPSYGSFKTEFIRKI